MIERREYLIKIICDEFMGVIRNVVPMKETGSYEKIDKKASRFPDEIDIYNFFEKYKGHAKCYHIFGCVVCCYTLNGYIKEYKKSDRIEYFIDDNRYYAIKFKDRGVFLVSEKRYKELKAKKG